MSWLEKSNELKKQSGKTTDEISEFSGIPKGTLNKLFAGQTKDPQLSTIKSLVQSLGHSLDDLDDTCPNDLASADIKQITMPEKTKLLNKIEQLNEVGCEEVSTYIDGFIDNPKYLNETAAEDAAQQDLA